MINKRILYLGNIMMIPENSLYEQRNKGILEGVYLTDQYIIN